MLAFKKKQKGLTLVEVVVSIIVLSIIALVVARFVESSSESYSATKNNIAVLTKLRLLDERLTKEIRRTNYSIGYDINTATNTVFGFTDVDGVTISFSYNGSDTVQVSYDVPAVISAISDQLTAFDFNYYQFDGTATAVLADIRFVEWVMTLTENGISYSLTNRVALRGSS